MAARGEIAEPGRTADRGPLRPAYQRTGQTRGRPVLERVAVTDLAAPD